MNNNTTKQEYFGLLDVLRFVTIMISFLHHSKLIHFIYGHTFFFVLSGFILTYQANKEYKKKGVFSLGNFTMRRILRIFPLYFLIVLFCFALLPWLSPTAITLPPVAYYITLTSNYYTVPHVFALMILWAVSVQEQFYLFISLCYKYLYKHLLLVSIFMILISLVFKVVAEKYQLSVYTHTLNHFSSFGIGVATALVFAGKGINIKNSLIKMTLLILPILFLIFASKINFPGWFILNNTVVSLFFSIIILLLCTESINTENNKVMTFFERLGKFSYGLYCFQGLVITFGNILFVKYLNVSNVVMITVFNLTLLLVVAYVSYVLFERPFLKLKKYFR